ncbi:alpha/beta hydrolase [Nocardia jiangxiensis]|uniref:Alpha/beta hydrolase n=1 Tax=Nocardia jiangxiensis TaxID=282685 RepID=A0ABW6SC49_9NOCA|nr:alpha/beta hydrolase [Nocardia jiangxiensis]
MTEIATVILVHGGWHDETCWDPLRAELDLRDIPSVAVRLPLIRLDTDAAVVRTTIEAQRGDVMVVAHSWGGGPVTLGASGLARVKHLIYLASFMLEAGVPSIPLAQRRRVTAGQAAKTAANNDEIAMDPSRARTTLYHDVDSELADRMIERLRPIAVSCNQEIATHRVAAWRTVTTTYAVCLQDRAIAPEDQRAMARNAHEAVELDTGHSPFLARPDLVGDLIANRYHRIQPGIGNPMPTVRE